VAGNIAELDVAIASVVEAEGKELTWWEVVDALYEAMKVEHAVLAQRFAVPTLHDVMEMLSRDIAQTSQRDLTYQHMCDLVEAIKTHIASFPLKSEATDIPHFGRAQLFAIDHSEFLEHKHEADVRQISTAVLISRLLATREMFIKVSDLYPPLYRSRYAHEEFLIRQKTPLLVFDDVHVLGASSAAMKQIAADCLNAARDRIIVRLSTQTFDQFKFVKGEIGLEAYILNAVKTVFILGVNGSEASFMSSQFNMPYDWVELCRYQLNGPKADGLDFVVCDAVAGEFHQAKLAVSPESIWETTSREDDIALVEIISAEIGRKRAVSRLAKRFKRGTAAFEIDTRLRKQDPQGNVRAIIERIATEVLMLA
jgi:intracellular multiplication protein IcmB